MNYGVMKFNVYLMRKYIDMIRFYKLFGDQ